MAFPPGPVLAIYLPRILTIQICGRTRHLRTYVFTQAQHNADEHLATEFTTSDAGGWGWERAEPVRVTCSDGNVNVGNRCVIDAGLTEGRVREPAASRAAS